MNLNAEDILTSESTIIENRNLIKNGDECDRYDYLAAIGCGAIAGAIDIFLVGMPGESTLGNWTDKQVDNAVKSFARTKGWPPRAGQENNVSSAIGYLENKFQVNYDQRHSGDVNNRFKMSTKNHHMMSLAHAPDPIGLFFSILNQFTSTSSFIVNGKLLTIDTGTSQLVGGNFRAKIFAGIANWFGHLMSDVAGASGSKGRGSGLVMPFYELFGLCKFGKFNVGKDKQDLATIAMRAFQEGYDFRHGLAMAIPVLITDLSIRLIWALRQRFQYKKPLKECIPLPTHRNLRVMLLFGNGTLCVIDGMDASIRSGGNFLTFFMRLNLVAWFRFTTLVLTEICIRLGLATFTLQLAAYKRINESYAIYLKELQQIDLELYKKEVEECNYMVKLLEQVSSDEELNVVLINIYDRMEFNKPWQGDFDEHMSNKNGTLVFE